MKHRTVKYSSKELNDFYFALLEKRDALRFHNEAQNKSKIEEIGLAIQKLKNGSYGQCEGCGQSIFQQLLIAFPEIRLCRACEVGIGDIKITAAH